MDIEKVELSIADSTDLTFPEGLPVEQASDDKPPAPAQDPPEKKEPDLKQAVEDAVVESLAKVAQHIPQTQAQTAQYTSYLQAEVARLKDQGIPDAAIVNLLNFHRAIRADEAQAQQVYAQQAAAQNYNGAVIQIALDALDAVSAPIKQLAKAGKGLREDLVAQMSDLVEKDPAFRDIKAAIDSRRLPSQNRMKEVAARVADAWCESNEITTKSKGLNIRNSRPESAGKDFDPNELGRADRQIYDLTLKYRKDPALARQRATARK